nr:conserved hypothetical protein [Hymenolepis microstoma]
MNEGGSRQDLMWNEPIDISTPATATAVTTTTTTPLLPEEDSEGPQKSVFSNPTSTADLLSPSAQTSMFLPDFARFPFPLPPLADFYNLPTNPMAGLLLAQVGAAALNSLNQSTPTSRSSVGGLEHKSSRNMFSIANHIREEVNEGENQGGKEERDTTKVEKSESNNGSLCCPICHEDLNSKDLSVHISLELEALDEETQRLQNCRFERNFYERCMNFNNRGLFDHISSSQRYYKFQMVKERRLARKRNLTYSKPQEEYSHSSQQSLKLPHTLESGFPLFSPQLVSNIPTKIRRIDK